MRVHENLMLHRLGLEIEFKATEIDNVVEFEVTNVTTLPETHAKLASYFEDEMKEVLVDFLHDCKDKCTR